MWTRTFFTLAAVAATALSPVAGANAADACAFTLSATSKSEWKVACADGTSSTAFDPSSLLGVKIGDNTAVELKPKAASQPVEVLVPTTFARIDPLISPTITSFALQREVGVKGKPDVTIDGSAFSQMTAMKKLYLGDINITVDGTIDLPPSLNELTINHGGLVDLKIKKYTALNITKINLRYNNLRHIPLIVFALRKVDFIDLFSNSIPALRISRRKLRRLRRLIATKRILLGDVADFVATCDGEKVTVEDNGTKFVVCQVEKEDDDDVVVESESTSGGDSTTGSSQTDTSSSTTTPTTTTSAPSSASDTTPAAASSAPTPTPTNAAATASLSAMPLAALAAIIASLVH